MRVLITGINGFVGSHLTDYILENHPEVEVYGTKRWRSSLDNISHCLDKIHLIDCDLRDLSSLISVFQTRFDKVFHLAAQSYVPFSYQAPIETLEDNVIGTANLLEAIRLNQDPLIHICSSSEVYGQVKPEDIPIKETQPFNPVSPYGVSKVAEDMLGLAYHTAYGLKTVRTRMFTHIGARQHEVFVCSNFAKQIALIEKGKQDVIYVGNLDSIRTFADVRDTVRAYWMLKDDMAGQVYNIGGTKSMTIQDMLENLISMSPIRREKVLLIRDSRRIRPSDVTLQIPDSSKFFTATGWQPQISFVQTTADLLNYWRERV